MNEKAKEQLQEVFIDKNIDEGHYYSWPESFCLNCKGHLHLGYPCDHILYPDLNKYLVELVDEEKFKILLHKRFTDYYEVYVGNNIDSGYLYKEEEEEEEDIKELKEKVKDLEKENEVLRADMELFDSIIKEPFIPGDTRPLKIQILNLEKEVEMLKDEDCLTYKMSYES